MDTDLNGVAAGSGMIYAGDYGVIPFDNSFPTDTEIYRIATADYYASGYPGTGTGTRRRGKGHLQREYR